MQINDNIKCLIQDLKTYENKELENPVQLAIANASDILNIPKNTAHFVFLDLLSKNPWFAQETNPYHNGVHTAQVIHSGAFLLAIEKQKNDKLIDEPMLVKMMPYFLLALMFHDYKHPGGANKFPFEIEKISFNELSKIILFDSAFYDVWEDSLEFEIDEKLPEILQVVEFLIMSTEVSVATPERVKLYLKEIGDGEIEAFTILSLLMSEADLLTSVLPDLGKDNGEKLAKELNLPVIATDFGRGSFLKKVKYVSLASQELGIQEMIDKEIKDIYDIR